MPKTSPPSSYRKLMDRSKDLFAFQSAASIVYWDLETMMPPKAINLRSQQLAMLTRIGHRMSTDPEIGKLLEDIMRPAEHDKLDDVQKRNVYLMKKDYDEQTKLPEELVSQIAEQHAITFDVWKKAKAAKKFAMFKPDMEKLFELKKKAAEILMEVKDTATPYDALVDIYEPKMTTKSISDIFGELRRGLVSILQKCEKSPKQPDMKILKRKVSIEAQRKIARTLAESVGYDVTSKEAGGRIDETEHPFTIGYYDDVRITTHYYEDDFKSSMFTVLHEAGHAIYDQSLNSKWIYQPVGTICSHGMTESQSRFVENIVGKSHEFWTYFLPRLKRIAGTALSDLNLNAFVHAVNQVKPSKIRVEADEVTYGLHIIIRFNVERDLFAGKIKINELPDVWNESYRNYLGVNVKNDSEGVMQDSHWAEGSYGYFPSYALGNIYGGQMLVAMEKDLPQWRKRLAKGHFSDIKQWLVRHVHSYGSLYDPADLITRICGQGLNVKPFLAYLENKYSKLYQF